MENIFSTTKQEIDDFVDLDIEIVDGYSFNQYDTIKRCHLYYNSQFEDNSEYNGMEKIFYNINKYRCDVATRLLDIDTKEIQLESNIPDQELATYLLEKELQLWLKKNNVASLLNRMAEELPIYGSVVIKKNKNAEFGVEVADLRRLFLDATSDRIGDSTFVTQKHYMTAPQLREMASKWEETDVVIEKFEDVFKESYENDEFRNTNKTTPYYVIYERYGEVPESWVIDGGDEEKMVRSMFIITDPDHSDNDKEGIVLFKSVWKGEYPFKDAHYTKTRGRWLGIGSIEDLFPEQERVNEIENQVRVAMSISSMQLWQSADQGILQNVLKDLESGDIIKKSAGGEGLLPVDNRIKNFQEFIAERQRYDMQADRKSHASDVVRGGDIPASTPATNAIIQNNNATSVFRYKRQGFVNMVRYFFTEFVLPQVQKDLTKEHVLRFTGDTTDLARIDKILNKKLTKDASVDSLLGGVPVTPEMEEMFSQEIGEKLKEKGAVRFIDIKEKMYYDLDFQFDIMIDGEQEDNQIAMQNRFTILTALVQNPGILNDPRIKALFYKYMEKAGVSPMEIELADQQATQQQQLAPEQQPQVPQELQPQVPQPQATPGRPQLT